MQIKQALYAFDFDQTYDLLWVEGLSIFHRLSGISGYLFPFNNLGYMPIALIERYTPDNLPWANEWTDINYEFLKIMSRTHLLDNDDLMGRSGNLQPAMVWNANNPQWRFQIPRIAFTITVQKTSDNPVSLTWLELAFTGINDKYGDRSVSYRKKCQIYNKKHLILEDNNPKIIRTFNLLRNSLVISEPNAVIITAPLDSLEATLYSNLENQLELILQQLGLTQPRIVTYVDLKINYELGFRDASSPTNLGKSYLNSKIDVPIPENPVYTEVPDWYYFASLIRANNNPWGELENLQDKGKPVSCLWNNNTQRLDFKIWNLNYITFEDSVTLTNTLPFFTTDEAFYFDWEGNDFQPTGQATIKPFDWTFLSNTDRQKPAQRYYFTIWATQDNNYIYRSNTNQQFLFTESFYNQIIPVFPFPSFIGTLDLRWFMVDKNNVNFTRPALGGYFQLSRFFKTYLVSSYTGFVFHPYVFRVPLIDSQLVPPGIVGAIGVEKIYSVKSNYTIGIIHENLEGEIRATRIINGSEDFIYYGESTISFDTRVAVHDFTFIESDLVTIPISLSIWDNEPLGKHQLTDLQAKTIIDTLVQTNYANLFGFTDPEQYWEQIVMPDSIRIKEIHAALEANTYANDPNTGNSLRTANLGYYVERIARVLGISVNPNGSIRSIRQSKFVRAGDNLPAGWPIGQWGRNEGGDTEGQSGGTSDQERDGIAYEVRSNRVSVNPFTGIADKIDLGGYVLVENFPQLLHVLLDDLDKGLGWQEAGSNIIPDANNQGRFASYEGMNSLLVEIAYMLSDLSRNIKGAHVSGLITQATLYEVLGGLGLPINFKTLKVEAEGNKEIHYPALDTGAPTLTDLLLMLALNLSALVGGKLNLYPKEDEQ